MLMKTVLTQRSNVFSHEARSMDFKKPVSPHVEFHLSSMILKSNIYNYSIDLIDEANHMKSTVNIFTEKILKRPVRISTEPQRF